MTGSGNSSSVIVTQCSSVIDALCFLGRNRECFPFRMAGQPTIDRAGFETCTYTIVEPESCLVLFAVSDSETRSPYLSHFLHELLMKSATMASFPMEID